jgi:hypothetical protein
VSGRTIAVNIASDGSKLDRIEGEDPESGKITPLFNPRTQRWYSHFMWSENGTRIIGTTPCGRATVNILKLNRPLAIAVRTHWVSINRHPPQE